jgi:hypothetical protein
MCREPGSRFLWSDIEEGEGGGTDFFRAFAGDEFCGDLVGADLFGDRVFVMFDGAGEFDDRQAWQELLIQITHRFAGADDAIGDCEFAQSRFDPSFVFGVEGHVGSPALGSACFLRDEGAEDIRE